MPEVPNIRIALASATVVILVGKLLAWKRKVKSLPPGPPKLPFVDNLLNMPKGLNWVQFHEISKQLETDIIHMSALGLSVVVLDNFEVAKELMENRSGIYSSRPISVMKHELAGMGGSLTMVPYGDRFRASRRMFAKHFGADNAKIYRPRELFYARRCLVQLLDNPNGFYYHLQHLVGSVSLSMTYGIRTRTINDEYLTMFERLVKAMSDIVGGGMFLVDVIPILKYLPGWFPGAGFQKQASDCAQIVTRTKETLFRVAQERMESPNHTPSFVSENLQEIERTQKHSDRDIVKNLALTVYLASADTTWSSLGTFMLAMVCYPEVQKKLQAELDAVLGGKLPDHDDVVGLPYLKAVFMEVIRWKPITPIGIPHSTTMDDVYKGYFIPKDSVVLANVWAMLQDPEVYPEPTKFNPERFLKDGEIDESIRSPYEIAFGFGRRICPGRHIAQSTFMMVAASILSTFNLRMKKDENGNPIQPPQDYHLSVISHPKEFPCDIVPRSPEARQLIVSWATSEGESPP